MKLLKLVLFAFLFFNSVASQNILISQGGTVNVSGGEIFYDAGGSAGNDGNTSYTITLTPSLGQSVCVDFTSFSSFETLEIFDGTTVSANNIGTLRGNYGTAYNAAGAPYNTGQPALGIAVQAELKPGIFCANNATGALTFRFTNSSASQSSGWIGNVITYAKPTTGCTVNLTANPSIICAGSATTLTAIGTIGSALINTDFNTSTLGSGWTGTPGGVAFVNVLGCQPNYGYNTQNTDGSIFAWMQNVVAPRVLESNGFDVSNGGVLSFDFREASDDNGGNGCEALDDREGVYIQYSLNNGASWTNMKLMFASVESNFPSAANIGCGTYVYNWNTTTVPIPAAAHSTNTKFRWYQNSSTTASQDSWGIDNVKIIKNNPITLTITDLLTNTVVASSTTNTVSVSVSPTSTRTYRATISDGVTSCTNDVLVTVNSGSATTINYSGSPFLTSAGVANVTVTNGPVSGLYSASPAGLTLNTSTGAITPNTSMPGTYTVSVPTSCGIATATVIITSSTCATCATPSCPVISITTSTAVLGQTGITTALNTAGDQLGNTLLVSGQSLTICVPVSVVSGSTILGFKQLSSSSPGGCGSPLEEVMTYQLTSTSCGATIAPNLTNASGVASGFNPEWNGLTPGNYVLCFTLNVTASALCTSVDLQGLGYYNVVPVCTNPIISSQPIATQTVCKDAPSTNLSITASGSALTYQWYSNSTNSSVGGTLIPLATGTSFSPSTITVGTFYYYCVVSSGTCSSTSNTSTLIVNTSTTPTYTKTVINCSPGSINFSSILPIGTTLNWISGPSGYTFPAGYQTSLTSNTNLTALPAGTYCVDITSPTSSGGVITSTLFSETFESGLGNWTLDNSNGPNIFVLNNQYVGGSCVTGLGTFTVPSVPNQPAAITSGPNSNYLHIKATTTTGATCGPGSVNFIPLNANFDGQISDQKATLNTVINTVGKTNVRFNFYWLAQGETNANGADDFGSIEYSINGGTTWVISGAKLRRQTTWLSDFRTDPLWDNQPNLRFRIRWNNDASSSVDPPISIDEIVITADSSTSASCGTTVQECIVINPTPAVPTITTTAATCSQAGSSTVSNYNAANTYAFTPSGPTVGAGGVISGMTVGTSYTVTSTNGGCTSAASVSFNNEAQLPTPAVPTITTTAATCSQAGSSTVSNYNAANTYAFTPSGPTVGSGGAISGMTVGTSYTVTATNGGCTSAASASFTASALLGKPVLTYTLTNPICDGSTLDFVLNSSIPGTTYTWNASNNGISGFMASGDQTTINQLVQLLDPMSTTGSISMVILPTANGCVGDPTSITILVKPNPRVISITQDDSALCSGEILHMDITGEPSGLTYNWTVVNNTGVLIPSGVTSGSTSGPIDLQLATISPTGSGTIQFQVIPLRNGCFGAPFLSDVITVNPIPGNPIGLPVDEICSGETTSLTISSFPSIAGTTLEWTVIDSQNVTGFTNGTGIAPSPINDLLINTSNVQGYVRYSVTSKLGNCIGGTTEYLVRVNPLPKPILNDGHICVDAISGNTYQGYVLDTQLSNPNYTYEWFILNTSTNSYDVIPGATASTYLAQVAGTYQVEVTDTTYPTNCSALAVDAAEVITVLPATAISATVSDAFTNNSTITVTVNSLGSSQLVYALDDGAWQDSNVFTGVTAGTHTVLVSDLEGCTNLTLDVMVIDYPKFFTPNADGINDTWNIIGLNQADAKLYIFDRYGKLIKQLSTTDQSKGWDGTYNGAQLPSTDYWFTLDYTENYQQKVFKSHFSLKR